MVMAFLPTAVLYWLSLVVMLGTFVVGVVFPSMTALAILLLGIAFACCVMAHLAAFRLYDNAMALAETDVETWYRVTQKIAKRCMGHTKTAVLLHMTEQLCRYERTEEVRQWLPRLKKRIWRSGSARLRFRYLMMVWRVKALEGDTAHWKELLGQLYLCLNVRSDWTNKRLRESRRAFERELLRMQFYSHTPEVLSTTQRPLTEAWHQTVRQHFQAQCHSEGESDYQILSDCYNVGLTYLLTGKEAAAVRYYRYILDSPYDYPLKQRMAQYLRSADAHVLLQTVT